MWEYGRLDARILCFWSIVGTGAAAEALGVEPCAGAKAQTPSHGRKLANNADATGTAFARTVFFV